MAKQGASSPKWLDKQDFSGVVSKYRECTLSLKTLNLDITRCRLADCHITVTVSKCVPHVQHDYFSSFNQSDHYFLASSLPLLPSLLDKIGSLNNHHHHDDGDKNVTNLHIWQWKTKYSFARLASAIFIFVHFATVLVFSRTWNDLLCSCVDDVSVWWQIFSIFQIAETNLIPGYLEYVSQA